MEEEERCASNYSPKNRQGKNLGMHLLTILLNPFGLLAKHLAVSISVTCLVSTVLFLTSLPFTHSDVRFDCYPDGGASQQNCESRGCTWQPADHDQDPVEPWCFFKAGVGYKYDSDCCNGAKVLKKNDGPKNPWGGDFDTLYLTSQYIGKTLNVKITTPDARYEPPVNFPRNASTSSDSLLLNFNTQSDPFSFSVTRGSNGETLFDTSIGGLIFADKFIQIATYLPSENMYGWGENIHQSLKHDFSKYHVWGMFARDEPPDSGQLDTKNLYGVHPFYLCLEPDGRAHGVLILNSNAQEVVTAPGPALIYRTIGGNLDLYFFPGPTPEQVIQQYQALIGKPFLPAYWALGYQLSRYGYKNLDEMKQRIGAVRDAGIPLEIGVTDIDYMNRYKDFTVGDNWNGFADWVKQMHDWGMKLIPIFDPAIEADYDSFQRGISNGAKFIEWERSDQVMQDIQKLYPLAQNTKIMLGVVWPDKHVGFPDFLDDTNKTNDWWISEFVQFHNQIPFDGIWIDMNEPSNFGTNDDHPWYYDSPDHPNDLPLKCPTSGDDATWDMPPYRTHAVYNFPDPSYLATKTLCMHAVQNNGKYRFYNTKNLYGLTEAISTQKALFQATGKRGAVVSRSTFPSAGAYTGHWLGDNTARWEDLRTSIIGAQEFNLFGIPYVGSDICGFIGATNEELCLRWQQMGAWHSFMRNHNDNGSPPQDPAQWASVAAATKKANLMRYTNLPYLFSLHFAASMNGGTVVRPVFFEFPTDTIASTLSYQFMWGSALIIAPVINQGVTQMDVYLPKGVWYSMFDYNFGGRYLEGYQRDIPTPITSNIPVFIRGGYIIPQQGPNMTTTASRQNPFQLTVAPDESMKATGFMYWDDGETIVKSFSNYPYHYWEFNYSSGASQSSLQVNHKITTGMVQVKTLNTITVFNSPEPNWDSFTLNGNPVSINKQTSSYNATTKILIISSSNLIPINNAQSYTLAWNTATTTSYLETNRVPDAA